MKQKYNQNNISHYGWKIIENEKNHNENKLVKEFSFKNFVSAIEFINSIEATCENQNHHPDILLHSYKKIKFFLYTHTENKITEKDYLLAEGIDEIWDNRNILKQL